MLDSWLALKCKLQYSEPVIHHILPATRCTAIRSDESSSTVFVNFLENGGTIEQIASWL